MMRSEGPSDAKLDAAADQSLDAALERILVPPALPSDFRRQLETVLTRSSETSLEEVRQRLEREQRERLAELESQFVRVRHRTLGTMIGAAFAAGAAAAIALPWLTASLGSVASLVIASVGAAAGLAIGARSWLTARAEADAGR